MKDQFVITAWWPPTLAAMPDYAAAGFNLVMGGNIGAACQSSGSEPTPATVDQMFDCIADALPTVDALGLKFAWGIGFFKKAAGLAGVRGASAGYGGVIDDTFDYVGNISVGAVSATELAWVVRQLRRRNLTHVVASYFLHDDVVTVNQATMDAVAWLRHNAPDIVPQVNSGSATTLYASRQHILSPEEYEINGRITNASQETANQLVMFAKNQYVAERFGLDNWPLFNVGELVFYCIATAHFSIFAEARVPALGQAMGVAIQIFSLTALFVSKCTAQLHMAPVGSTIIAG